MGVCEQRKVRVSSECGTIPLRLCEEQSGEGGWGEGLGARG